MIPMCPQLSPERNESKEVDTESKPICPELNRICPESNRVRHDSNIHCPKESWRRPVSQCCASYHNRPPAELQHHRHERLLPTSQRKPPNLPAHLTSHPTPGKETCPTCVHAPPQNKARTPTVQPAKPEQLRNPKGPCPGAWL